MPFFEEFPFDRVVNVHWHKKKDDGGGGEDDLPCGAFRHGWGLWDASVPTINYGDIPGQSIFYLTGSSIYGLGFVMPSDPDSKQPYSYWPSVGDYLRRGQPIRSTDLPWLWGSPSGWTLVVDQAELDYRTTLLNPGRGYTVESIFIQEFRNINPQALRIGLPVEADHEVASNTIDIATQMEGEVYPPGFRVGMNVRTRLGGLFRAFSIYPPTTIQAHCKNETAGGLPPQDNRHSPLGGVAPGSTDWPLRPPPPPPFT